MLKNDINEANIRVMWLKQVNPPLTGPAYQFRTLWSIGPDGSDWS